MSAEAPLIAQIDRGSITHHEAGRTFLELLQAGAIHSANPSGPRPLVHRCHCGRPISGNKPCCRACGMDALKEAAKHIRTTPELEAFLAQFDPALRPEVEALVKPIMMERWKQSGEPIESDESYEASAALLEAKA